MLWGIKKDASIYINGENFYVFYLCRLLLRLFELRRLTWIPCVLLDILSTGGLFGERSRIDTLGLGWQRCLIVLHDLRDFTCTVVYIFVVKACRMKIFPLLLGYFRQDKRLHLLGGGRRHLFAILNVPIPSKGLEKLAFVNPFSF